MRIILKALRKFLRIVAELRFVSFAETIEVMQGKKLIAYWSNLKETKKNFGDAVNPVILEHYLGKPVVHSSHILNVCFRPKIFFIGSILDNLCSFNSVIIGAGIKSKNSHIFIKPSAVLAVRGPLTREKLIEGGVECPKIYCDPALLLREIIQVAASEKEYDVGIIPHYADKMVMETITVLSDGYKVLIIDIEDSYENVIRDINRCSRIFSSSLHGIIVSHAYGIPALWIKLSDNVVGDDFKFRDYYFSVGEEKPERLLVSDKLDIASSIGLSKCYNVSDNIAQIKTQLLLLKKIVC